MSEEAPTWDTPTWGADVPVYVNGEKTADVAPADLSADKIRDIALGAGLARFHVKVTLRDGSTEYIDPSFSNWSDVTRVDIISAGEKAGL